MIGKVLKKNFIKQIGLYTAKSVVRDLHRWLPILADILIGLLYRKAGFLIWKIIQFHSGGKITVSITVVKLWIYQHKNL